MSIGFLDSEYIIVSSMLIRIYNAIESLSFGIQAEGLHMLPYAGNNFGDASKRSMIFPDINNYGICYFKVTRHDVKYSLCLKFKSLGITVI